MALDAETTDESLLSRVRNGDRQAFSFLVARHAVRFRALAWRMTGDTAEAEDIVQAAFVKLWTAPGAFDPERGVKFTTWFYRVVSNLCLDHARRRKRQVVVPDMEMLSATPHTPAPEQDYIARQEQAMLESAIHALPDRQRMALTLCFYEGLSNREAADIMQVNIKALESLLTRAREGIKNDLIRRGVIERKEVRYGRN